MTYVIGYKNQVMNVPSIVYGPFDTLTQAMKALPQRDIKSYKVYQLIEVNVEEDNNTEQILCIY